MDRSAVVVVRVLFALSNKLRGRRIKEVERDYTTWIASMRGKERFRFRLTMDVLPLSKTDNKIFSNLSLVCSSICEIGFTCRQKEKEERESQRLVQ